MGVVVGAFMVPVNAVVRRVGVKTRQDIMAGDINESKNSVKTILRVLPPVLLSVKGKKPNGKFDAALKLPNQYTIEKR